MCFFLMLYNSKRLANELQKINHYIDEQTRLAVANDLVNLASSAPLTKNNSQ